MKTFTSTKPATTKLRLDDRMKELGIKYQSELLKRAKPYCERYGVKLNKSDISQYLSGKTEPNQDKLVILSLTLGVCEAWLMGYDVEKECDPKRLNKSESGELQKALVSLYGDTQGEMIQQLIQMFGDLTESNKNAIMTMVEGLYSSPANRIDEKGEAEKMA